jgi:hypothetical protein
MDKSMLKSIVFGVNTPTAGGSIAGFNSGVAMIGRVLKNFSQRVLDNLIQEVPEALSVCEFDCPYNECTVRDWVECELRHEASLPGTAVSRSLTGVRAAP